MSGEEEFIEEEEEVILDSLATTEDKSKRKKQSNGGGKRGRKKAKENELEEGKKSEGEDGNESHNSSSGGTKDKRATRLEKNREAAHQFRQRQKVYLQELESKVTELTTENAQNKATLELLRSENQLIREQLNYLRTFISQAVSFSSTFSQGGTISIPPALAAGLQAAGDILSTPPILPNPPNPSNDSESGRKKKESPEK